MHYRYLSGRTAKAVESNLDPNPERRPECDHTQRDTFPNRFNGRIFRLACCFQHHISSIRHRPLVCSSAPLLNFLFTPRVEGIVHGELKLHLLLVVDSMQESEAVSYGFESRPFR